MMEELDCIHRWLSELKTEETKKQFLRDMRVFTDWAAVTPDHLISERWRNLKSDNPTDILHAKDRLMKFWHEAPFKKSSKSHTIAALKSFYRSNGMALSMRTPKAEKVREHEHIPTHPEIQRMVETCDSKRDQALIMIDAETGFRVGALVGLQWKHLCDELERPSLMPKQNPVKVKIPWAITEPGITFICDDAISYLRRWLLGKQLDGETYIFDIDEDRAGEIISGAGTRIGINPNGRGFKPFHSHCFRKRFQSICESEGIKLHPITINHLLDHKSPGMEDAYSRPSVEDLRQAYAKAAPALRVF